MIRPAAIMPCIFPVPHGGMGATGRRCPQCANKCFQAKTQPFDDLPDGGQHGRRTLAFAPDGALHINIGSSCDACFESSDEKAANLRLDLNIKKRTVFAKGLRNMLGFDWHPETGVMWGVDHGVDHLGDDLPGEELNQDRRGRALRLALLLWRSAARLGKLHHAGGGAQGRVLQHQDRRAGADV